ncbi:Uma2 family endonuclease [Dehalococcoidia bacterium]|nr:Uma2 family endonuclease [Dehalococcoidia bacterium]
MKGTVLDAEDIFRPTKEKILIPQELKQVVGKGYLLEAGRWLKELRSEHEIWVEPISFEEFLEWCDEDTLAEWVEGEVIIHSPASRQHQELFGSLLSVLKAFVQVKGLGRVYGEQFMVKLLHKEACRMPDILFISKERENQLKGTYFEGSPDLIVEITSQESRRRDKGEKFQEYEREGVKEYWLIDPELKEAHFYRRDEEGKLREENPDASGIYYSKVLPGFKLKAEWLWQDSPSIMEALQELGLF